MEAGLEVGTVGFQDDGKNVIITVELRNQTGRTLHAYAGPRRIYYEPATYTLTILLTDRQEPELFASTFIQPRLRAVDSHGATVLKLVLPRVLTRFASSPEKTVEPQFEKLPIYQATTVVVQVAWSDRPFYADPREPLRAM